jgi:hypothetical protein
MSERSRYLLLFALTLLATAGAVWVSLHAIAGRVNEELVIGLTFGLVGIVYAIARRLLRFSISDVDRSAIRQSVSGTPEATEPRGDRGKICIYREPEYSDKYRAYSVVADGAVVGRLAPGETCTLSLPVGEHQIAAKIDWGGSNTIHVNVSSEKTEFLRVRSNLRGIRVALGLWYVLFSRRSYLCVEHGENSGRG